MLQYDQVGGPVMCGHIPARLDSKSLLHLCGNNAAHSYKATLLGYLEALKALKHEVVQHCLIDYPFYLLFTLKMHITEFVSI